jgi:hypothetical protein
MKTWIAILATGAAMWAADKPAERKAADTKPATKQASRMRAPETVPAGAVETNPGTWHYTDAAGRKWIYRQTPWGLARFEDKQGVTANGEAQKKEADVIKAVEDGDSIRFERPGPFGTYKWSRKKTELNESEQKAWDRARTGAAPRQDKQE